MSQRQELEKRKLAESARIAQGFGNGFNVSSGLVIGADLLGVAGYQSAKGIVIPCMNSPHIRMVVGTE